MTFYVQEDHIKQGLTFMKLCRNNRERRLREERGDRMLLSSPNMSSEQARKKDAT